MIHYKVVLEKPNSHIFKVILSLTQKVERDLTLTLPSWIPGSYMIRDFSKNIVSMHAGVNGNSINITKISKACWNVPAFSGDLQIIYEVYALDLSVRSAYMDNSFSFFNGTSVFLKANEFESDFHQVEIVKPSLDFCSNWKVFCSLVPDKPSGDGFTTYTAKNYVQLIDHPFLIGDSIDVDFNVQGIPHSLHLVGDLPRNIDTEQLSEDLTQICTQQSALFKHDLPISQYKFLTMVIENGYGGLEHKDSTALICAPGDLPSEYSDDQTKTYRNFLGLCSHEYLHLWNVKRITPALFQQSDLSSETHSELLWFFEGVTSYYDDLALLRSGCITIQDYLGLMANTLTRYFRTRGRFKQNLVDSSFDAWTKFYKQDSNSINAIVSYYTKGAVVAFGLDIMIRKVSNNCSSLDGFMRHLWKNFGSKEIGIKEHQIEEELEMFTGINFKDFFDLCLRSTKELPINDWLNQIGIGMNLRPANTGDDVGGAIKEDKLHEVLLNEGKKVNTATLGLKFKAGSNLIQYVLSGEAGENAGLSPDDEMVAIDGIKITPSNQESVINQLRIDDVIDVHYFRRGRLRSTQVKVDAKPLDTCDLYLIPDSQCSQQQHSLLASWKASLVA